MKCCMSCPNVVHVEVEIIFLNLQQYMKRKKKNNSIVMSRDDDNNTGHTWLSSLT